MTTFGRHMANARGSDFVVLKCAIKMADGTAAWCDFDQGDWTDVIRPNEDEIGVFLQGSPNLPYKPSAGPGNSASSFAARRASSQISPSTKLVRITCQQEEKAVYAPQSLNALRVAAKSMFPVLGGLNFITPDKIAFKATIQVPGSPNTFVYLEDATYPTWLERQGEEIALILETAWTK